MGPVDTHQAADGHRVGTCGASPAFPRRPSLFYFAVHTTYVVDSFPARRAASRLFRPPRRKRSERSRHPRATLVAFCRQAFDLAARFASKSALLLFVLAFWGLLLYSWYRSF